MLGRVGRMVEAEAFIEGMDEESDGAVWGALLGACRMLGNLDVAERVAERLYGKGGCLFLIHLNSAESRLSSNGTLPATDMIVGQDLVEWQIHVAYGEPLPLTQSEVPLSGVDGCTCCPPISSFCLFEDHLAQMGVMIQHYNNNELKGYVRISVWEA
ncbi:hypothetical protein MRB53_026173 [Persea americana]|uniref:Uncharacterized protein n=1 Tax=Persea americana TaxID=3435 RepID=A0ACC2LIG4_PERAE|nr:hypothetical protein MRB53_026173 [Persea americana]